MKKKKKKKKKMMMMFMVQTLLKTSAVHRWPFCLTTILVFVLTVVAFIRENLGTSLVGNVPRAHLSGCCHVLGYSTLQSTARWQYS
jgi:hypothetical protein